MTARHARDWRESAACRDEDPELFFPVATLGQEFEAQAAQAKKVCRRCPVRAACLAEALTRIPCGIAGGLTEDERRALARARRDGRSPASLPAERRSRGQALLAAGVTPRAVATRCQVSERTAYRWARGGDV